MKGNMKRFAAPKSGGGNDYVIVALAALLVTFGLAMLASASSHMAAGTGDSLYYLKRQIMGGLGLGMLGFAIASHIRYKAYEQYAGLGLVIGIILLSLTFTPLGIAAKGAVRWVRVGPLSFQPSEPLKIFFIIYIAAWLANGRGQNRDARKGFITFLVILATIAGLLIRQPATSAAVLMIVVAGIMYFASGGRVTYIAMIGAIGVAALAIAIWMAPYRLARIKAFMDPEANRETSGYQVIQAKYALGSGGMVGRGYGESTAKLNYLPEPIGDSIFAVIGEELGFAGCMTLAGLLLALVVRLFLLAHATRDRFGKLILVGFGSLIAVQSFVNIGAISGLMPLTGMPLPFISYGSTALVVFLTMMGVANNIAKHET